uniref:SJCHGC03710 protein n=1 Tax=Schistosoma japonicum TaxID=6182 RepID=Q5DHH1_SCHJA|nr:SJCHGC03710 protein [Schistosoma japonicum]
MGCNHIVDYHIFKNILCLEYVSDTRRNLNCTLCLISVISDSLLHYDVRESYVYKFLNFLKSNKHHLDVVSCSEKLLQKSMMIMLGVNYEELFSDYQCFNLGFYVICFFLLVIS